MNTGEGLHRFVDPVDGEVYLYASSRCADCRRMFAVFEQPDLKATLRLHRHRARPLAGRVQLPHARSPTPAGEGVATWAFAPDPADVLLHHRARRRPLRRGARRGADPARAPCRSASSAASRCSSTSTPTTSSTAPSAASPSSRTSSTASTRSRSTTSSSRRSTTWARWRTPAAVTITEIYVFRSKVTEAIVERRALTDPARAGPHVVRQPRDDAAGGTTCGSTSRSPSGPRPPARPRPPTGPSAWTTFGTSREGLGLPPGPAVLDAPDRRRRSATSRTSRSTSTASPTPRAPRCSSSSSPTSAASRSSPGCAPTSPSTPGATPPSPTCSRELEATSGRDLRTWSQAVARDRRRQHPAPRVEVDDRGPDRLGRRSSRPAPPGFATLRPHRLGDRPVRRRAATRCVRTDRLELDVDGESHRRARAGRPAAARPAAGQRRRPRLRQDPPRRALARHGPGPPARVQDSLPRALVLGAAWDMTRDAEMSRPRLRRRSCSRRCRARPTRPCCAPCSASCRPPLHLYVAPAHRDGGRSPTPSAALRDWPRRPSPAATPSSSSSARMPRCSAAATTRHTCVACSTAREVLDGPRRRHRHALDAAHLARRGRRRRRRTRSTPSCARDNTATGRERAEQARAALPTAEAKADGLAPRRSRRTGCPTRSLEAVASGFGTAHDTDAARALRREVPRDARHRGGPGLARHHRDRSSAASTHRRSPTPRLHDATQAWLDAHPDAPAALRRLVAENRDPSRAPCAAQERDADA